jgi:RNA polymerase sigma-70 factor (ECF subfamily)
MRNEKGCGMGKDDGYEIVIDFIAENRDSAYRLAYSYVNNKEDALDIIQDSICKALASVKHLKNTERIKPWFYRILVNSAIDMLRKNKKYTSLGVKTLEAAQSDPVDNYLKFEINNALDILPIKNKTIIMLRFYEDMTLEEIANIMDENINTIKTRLYSSLKKMNIHLQEYDKDVVDKEVLL